MNKTTSLRLTAAVTAVLLFAGCQTAGKRTAIGGVGGAAAGAGIGALIGGGKGALIGAGVGALAGGSVGLYLDKQKKELEAVAETKRTENGLLVQMKGDILFDTGSAALKPEAITQLSQVGDILAKYGDDRVRIEGHTDSVGTTSSNEALSLRRADAVKTVLARPRRAGEADHRARHGRDPAGRRQHQRRRQGQEPSRRAAHRRAESYLTGAAPPPRRRSRRGPTPAARGP